MRITKKRSGFGLQMATMQGGKGNYLFFKTANGAYHAFLEVATKEAAKDCATKPIKGSANTRKICKDILGF